MIGCRIRYSIVHNNTTKKETKCYETRIKGMHSQDKGCWKCRGEVEHNFGVIMLH